MSRRKIHGESGTALYRVWRHIIDRCLYPNCKEYGRYGGRGIFVCEEWINSYLKFKSEVGEAYISGLQLDRINNDDGYYKGNVRWVTRKQNNNNRRDNCRIEFNGITKTATEWGEELGINRKCIAERCRLGYKGEVAIYGPYFLQKKGKHRAD